MTSVPPDRAGCVHVGHAAARGCAPEYNDAEVIGGNKVGARTIQLDVLSEIKSCAQTLIANGPVTVSCALAGPGSLAATSTFTLHRPAGRHHHRRQRRPRDPAGAGVRVRLQRHLRGPLQRPAGDHDADGAAGRRQHPVDCAGGRYQAGDVRSAARQRLCIASSSIFPRPARHPHRCRSRCCSSARSPPVVRDYYPPVMPCTNNFAAIPALLLPSLGFYAPIDNTPIATRRAATTRRTASRRGGRRRRVLHAGCDHYFMTWGTARNCGAGRGHGHQGVDAYGPPVQGVHHAVAGSRAKSAASTSRRGWATPTSYGRGDAECA